MTKEQWLIESIKVIMANDQTRNATKALLVKDLLAAYDSMCRRNDNCLGEIV